MCYIHIYMPKPTENKKINNTNALYFVGVCVLAGIIFFAGFFVARLNFHTLTNSAQAQVQIYQMRQSTLSGSMYSFINPLMGCEIAGKDAHTEFTALRETIKKYVGQATSTQKISDASVYVDTRDGHWMGFDSTQTYHPASLMKVPMLIAVLKMAETNPKLLNQKIYYPGGTDLNTGQYFMPAHSMKQKSFYTVAELLERMIVYSDNNALRLLIDNLDVDKVSGVYADLGFPLPTDSQANTLENMLTVKSYANTFRILYNATYLSRDMSEKALRLLSESDFNAGIVAGTPASTVVAHKFGERSFVGDPVKELHDCGIVYNTKQPYLVCIMTRGSNMNNLTASIADIAKFVSDYFTSTTDFVSTNR